MQTLIGKRVLMFVDDVYEDLELCTPNCALKKPEPKW